MAVGRRQDWVLLLVAVLTINGAYLAAFAAPTFAYVAGVLIHVFFGALASILWFRWTQAVVREKRYPAAWILASVAVLSGLLLLAAGNPASRWILRITHDSFALTAALVLIFGSTLARRGEGTRRRVAGIAVVVLSLVILLVHQLGRPMDSIGNNELSPVTLSGDAMGGDVGPFFPSSSATASGDTIPASFFLGSQTCQRCHADVFDQWNASAHHFSSFNNQWYRKSIEYMQDVVGTKAPQWCAGCHDPALLFSGRMDQPVQTFLESEAAQAGLGCVACHAVSSVKSTRGNGGYIIEYPALHDLVESDKPIVRKIHDFVLHVDSGPHRTAFLQPFQTKQPAEFCQTCHKVHLDEPVNNYRWIRGFNTYDNWQASGVSGQGARSFYAPPNPLDCVDCHMQQVPSRDRGHADGFVASHRFAAANTALPTANVDSSQMREVVRFLQNGTLSIDLFGLTVAPDPPDAIDGRETVTRDIGVVGKLATGFAAGEESAEAGLPAIRQDTLAIAAPLDQVPVVVRPGESYRLDVVTRSRIVGHFFPTGTVDAQEAWVEVEAIDDSGRRFFWSGFVEADGRVDSSAHFFKSVAVDAAGNRIDKRNAWSMRSVVYVNLVPPGAADIAHFRIHIPEDVRGQVRFVARLNYRKFTDDYTKFAYAGTWASSDTAKSLVTLDYDNRRFEYTGDLATVSGPTKRIPDPPIVVIATDTVSVTVGSGLAVAASARGSWERWTDYGIGLLAEGDLRAAERAFRYAASASPEQPDSWVNLARVFLADDRVDSTEAALERALELHPTFHKAKFFRAMSRKASGSYEAAVEDLDAVLAAFPRDRVALNQRSRLFFLMRRLSEAAAGFRDVLRIDSEDLMAHYNLMLVYRAQGDTVLSRQHELRYTRYKDDDDTQAIAREYRARHPHDNNEAQPIHEHVSFWRPSVLARPEVTERRR